MSHGRLMMTHWYDEFNDCYTILCLACLWIYSSVSTFDSLLLYQPFHLNSWQNNWESQSEIHLRSTKLPRRDFWWGRCRSVTTFTQWKWNIDSQWKVLTGVFTNLDRDWRVIFEISNHYFDFWDYHSHSILVHLWFLVKLNNFQTKNVSETNSDLS